jgi:CHRD domain-containing protein
MSKALKIGVVAAMTIILGAAAMAASAATQFTVRTALTGYQEVPAVSTTGHGTFRAEITTGNKIKFRLRYSDLEGAVQQAHIHFGQKDVNGAITVFLCTNLGNGPVGTPACPPAPGEVTGTLTAEDITTIAAAQGITTGEFGELRRAIRNGVTYVNVHSTMWPGGEARGQLRVVD